MELCLLVKLQIDFVDCSGNQMTVWLGITTIRWQHKFDSNCSCFVSDIIYFFSVSGYHISVELLMGFMALCRMASTCFK
jgi:hypothetical protein